MHDSAFLRRALPAAACRACGSAAPPPGTTTSCSSASTPYVPTPQDVVERMLDFAGAQARRDTGRPRLRRRPHRRHGGEARRARLRRRHQSRSCVAGEPTPTPPRPASATAPRFEVKRPVQDRYQQGRRADDSISCRWSISTCGRASSTQMRPGARIVAHAFHMGDDWPPDATDNIRGRVLFYLGVPAQGRRALAGARARTATSRSTSSRPSRCSRPRAHVDRRTLPKIVEPHTTQSATAGSTARRSASWSTSANGPRVFRGRVEGDTIYGIAPHGWKASDSE